MYSMTVGIFNSLHRKIYDNRGIIINASLLILSEMLLRAAMGQEPSTEDLCKTLLFLSKGCHEECQTVYVDGTPMGEEQSCAFNKIFCDGLEEMQEQHPELSVDECMDLLGDYNGPCP